MRSSLSSRLSWTSTWASIDEDGGGARLQDMTAARLRSLLPADVPMLLPGPGASVLDAARAALRTLAKEEET